MIQIGCKPIDELIGGELPNKVISQFYGPSGTGKTNICLHTLSKVAAKKKVVFIDTEGGFSEKRLKQIAGSDFDKVVANTLLFEPTNFEEQSRCIDKIKEIQGASLIIVDSMAALYRLELSQEKYQETNRELGRQLSSLLAIARKSNIPVLITNQVYTDINTGSTESVGGDILRYNSKVILELQKHGPGMRKARIKKHICKKEDDEALFTIVEKGIQ